MTDEKGMELTKLQKQFILPNEKGIVSRHGRGFYFASSFAKNNLCHLLWSDEYICDSRYLVNRDSLNSYMLMNLVDGRMTVKTESGTWSAGSGSLIFLDLRKHHFYKAESAVQVQQFMMNGGVLPAYFELLTADNGPLFRKDSRLQYLMKSLQNETLVTVPDDHNIAMLINSILCSLTGAAKMKHQTDPVRQAQYYINDHYNDGITLEDIAASVGLSKYYFSRQFEKETGSSPWEFLIAVRIRNAMQMLAHGGDSVEEIAFSCGFSSTAHFIRIFKARTNFTPGAFRRHFRDVPMGFLFPDE